MGKLVPCGGGDPIPLLEPELVIGRLVDCDIRLKFSSVSGHHCRLKFEEGFWFVHDLNSRNGVKVDGVLCTSKCLLPESILSVSKHRLQIFYKPKADAPPPEQKPFEQSLLKKAGLQDTDAPDGIPRSMEYDEESEPNQRFLLE